MGRRTGPSICPAALVSLFFTVLFLFAVSFLVVIYLLFVAKHQLLSSILFHAKAQSSQRKTKINLLRILASLRLCERILFGSGLSGLGFMVHN